MFQGSGVQRGVGVVHWGLGPRVRGIPATGVGLLRSRFGPDAGL